MARKFKLINSLPDTANVCKKLAKEYDEQIHELIESGQPLDIERLIEAPALIAHELFEGQLIDKDSRRYILS